MKRSSEITRKIRQHPYDRAGRNKVGEARNQGLEKAQGEYVLFLDSDDYLPDASVMQRYVRMAEQTDADIVVANYARLWNGKCCLQSATHLFQISSRFSGISVSRLLFRRDTFLCLGKTLSQIVSGKESDPFRKI